MMQMLGDLLASASQRSDQVERLLEARDPAMQARVAIAAHACGFGPGELVRNAVAAFSRYASEEDWASVMSALRETDDPAAAFMIGALQWSLRPEVEAVLFPEQCGGERDGEPG